MNICAKLVWQNTLQNMAKMFRMEIPFMNDDGILRLNRNARKPTKSNRGARPCSHVMRRLKKRQYYRKYKEEMLHDPDVEDITKIGLF